MKCLSDNNYDYSKCQQFFDDFKKCKTDWVSYDVIFTCNIVKFNDEKLVELKVGESKK